MKLPDPPANLEGEGYQYWIDNIEAINQRAMVTEANLVLFKRLCYQVMLAEEAAAILDRVEVYETKIDANGNAVTKPHAAVSVLKTAEDQICRLGRQLELWGRQASRESAYEDAGPKGTVDELGVRKRLTIKQA